MRKRGGKVEDLLKSLENDPEYKNRIRERDAKRQARVAQNMIDMKPLVVAIRGAGFPIEWPADLRHDGYNYESIIPLLIEWLPRVTNVDVKEDLVRNLTVKWARPQAALPLIAEYRKTPVDEGPFGGLKWAIANALAEVADDSVADEIIDLALDPANAGARNILTLALVRLKSPRARSAILALLDEEDSVLLALKAVSRKRMAEARDKVAALTNHPDAATRKQARKTLLVLDKAREGGQHGKGTLAAERAG